MGIQMAASHGVTQAAPSAAALMPGCPMHPQAATPGGSTSDMANDIANDNTSDQHTANCTACDLCTPMAELSVTGPAIVVHGTDTQPRMLTASFVSAALAPTVKPPIF